MSKKKVEISGIPAGKLVLPIVAVLVVLHLLIISVIFMINKTSSDLSTTMKNAGTYNQEATSLLAGSSLLSETAGNFVLLPVSETGEINVGPLAAYASELMQDRRGADVLGRFENYDVPEKAMEYLSVAAECANNMLDAQLHAIALIRSVYPVPNLPQFASIPEYTLTQEELGMADDQREALARTLVLGSVYALNKQSVSQNVNACVGVLEEYSNQNAAAASRRLGILRTMMWAFTLTIIAILTVTFLLLFTQLILPLGKIARTIPTGSALNEKAGFREVRLVAVAYNDVRDRRDTLDDILRSAAETDALTKLPNRYRFEQYIIEAEDKGYSVAMFLFDVNYLKKTNDTLGHLEGDKLLVSAAECISRCFGDNCFRFGGDEFAAIVRDCTPESIEAMITRFEETEKEENISISFGCAYTDEIGRTTFKNLLSEADEKMYAQKEHIHRQG